MLNLLSLHQEGSAHGGAVEVHPTYKGGIDIPLVRKDKPGGGGTQAMHHASSKENSAHNGGWRGR